MTETPEPEARVHDAGPAAPVDARSDATASSRRARRTHVGVLDQVQGARLHHDRRDLRRVPRSRARHRRVARPVGHVRVARHQSARRDRRRVAARRPAPRRVRSTAPSTNRRRARRSEHRAERRAAARDVTGATRRRSYDEPDAELQRSRAARRGRRTPRAAASTRYACTSRRSARSRCSPPSRK